MKDAGQDSMADPKLQVFKLATLAFMAKMSKDVLKSKCNYIPFCELFVGEVCVACQCNGNTDPSDPEACDHVTGKCLKCLNNTYGDSCGRCAPGYFGDAVTAKDCQRKLYFSGSSHFYRILNDLGNISK